MKVYHTELVEQHPLKNYFQERLNVMAQAGWTYVNHVFVRSYNKSKDVHQTSIFSLVLERDQ
jgi:hypothetical protein